MYQVKKTEQFKKWSKKLKDDTAKARIAMRVMQVEHGKFGDTKSVGD